MPVNDFIITAFNIDEDDIEQLDVKSDGEELIVTLKLKAKPLDCPYCGGKPVIKDYRKVKILSGDMNHRKTVIYLKKRRYTCKVCHRFFNEELNLGPKNTNVSWSVIKAIMEDLGRLNETYTSIGERHHISASLVQKYADSFLIVPRLHLTESSGIDELHEPGLSKRQSPYIAIIVDNVHRDLLEILKSRSKEELGRYFSSIPKEERLMVRYVTIDLWEPYRDAAETWLPNAKICADPFHVVKIVTKAFDDYRIKIMNQYDRNSKAYYLLKTWSKLLLSDDYDFDPNNKGKYNAAFGQHLNYYQLRKMILDIDPLLKKAYELKEEFRTFIRVTSPDMAKDNFKIILKDFEDSGLSFYQGFIGTLKTWRIAIINSFDRPYDNRKQSNALAEFINQKLDTLVILARGLTNFERTRARALYILNKHVHYTLTDIFHSKKEKGKKRGKYNKSK